MTDDLPCNDLDCWCCHPEERHSCPGPYQDSTKSWTCPECGVTWIERHDRPRHWPDSQPSPAAYWQADQRVPLVSEIARRRESGHVS